MAQIEIIKNQYNTICDTYGCNNIGTKVIGKPGENMGQRVIICDECLQNIINQAPLDMVLNRPGLVEIKKEKFIPEDSEHGKFSGEDLKPGMLNVIYSDMKFNELKEIANSRGITVAFGTSKDDLIKLLEDKK